MRLARLALSASLFTLALAACAGPEFDGEGRPRPSGGGEDIPAADPPPTTTDDDATEPSGPTTDPTTTPPGPTCQDACDGQAEGALRCAPTSDASFQTCTRGANGCLAWADSPCAEGVTKCSDAPKLCQGKCGADLCKVGETSCDGDRQRVCQMVDGCPARSNAQSCPGANERCIGTKCATACTSNCPTAGAKRCSSSAAFQECKAVAGFPSCLQWTASTSCGAGNVCQGSGSCVKACTDECTGPVCSSNRYYECKIVNGCKKRVLQDDCPAKDAYCGAIGGGEVACKACNSTCTNPFFQCTGSTSYVSCVQQSNGCKYQKSGSCTNCFVDKTTCN